MSPEQTVDRFIAAIEAKDVDAAIALAAPDVSYENMPMQPILGRDALGQTLHAFLDLASEVDWRIDRQWLVGSTVVNERLDRFRIGDGWLELPVAGFFDVDDDGLIAVWRDYFDLATYTNRLGELTGG